MTCGSPSPARPARTPHWPAGAPWPHRTCSSARSAGNDPNWGRVVSSLGTVPETVAPYDPNRVTVDINGVRICDGGKPGRDRSEVDMTPREVHIDIDLNAGDAEATVWTDDLTHEYVHINADYES